MKKSDEGELLVGVAWYSPAQWQRLRDISDDPDDMPDSYVEWLRLAEENLNYLRRSGIKVKKVDIDCEELVRWCNEQGLKITGEARSRYALQKVSEVNQNQSLITGSA
jgi:hypothetical protein